MKHKQKRSALFIYSAVRLQSEGINKVRKFISYRYSLLLILMKSQGPSHDKYLQ